MQQGTRLLSTIPDEGRVLLLRGYWSGAGGGRGSIPTPSPSVYCYMLEEHFSEFNYAGVPSTIKWKNLGNDIYGFDVSRDYPQQNFSLKSYYSSSDGEYVFPDSRFKYEDKVERSQTGVPIYTFTGMFTTKNILKTETERDYFDLFDEFKQTSNDFFNEQKQEEILFSDIPRLNINGGSVKFNRHYQSGGGFVYTHAHPFSTLRPDYIQTRWDDVDDKRFNTDIATQRYLLDGGHWFGNYEIDVKLNELGRSGHNISNLKIDITGDWTRVFQGVNIEDYEYYRFFGAYLTIVKEV